MTKAKSAWFLGIWALCKKELKLLFLQPTTYICFSVLTIGCALQFFLRGHFFEYGLGTADLGLFFTAIPLISVLTVPPLTMGQWKKGGFVCDSSLPLSETQLVLGKWLAAFMVALAMVMPGMCVPVVVSFFGTPDGAQVIAGYVGITFFLATATALGVFLGALTSGPVLSFFVTALVLFLFNVIHLVPLYFSSSDFVTALCQNLSFAWHFDRAGKGIIDSRDLVFYLLVTFVLLKASSLILSFKKRGCL